MSFHRERGLAWCALARAAGRVHPIWLVRRSALASLVVLIVVLSACQPATAPAPTNLTQPPTMPAAATPPPAVAISTVAPTALPPPTVAVPTRTSLPPPTAVPTATAMPAAAPTATAMPTAVLTSTAVPTSVPTNPAPTRTSTSTSAPAAGQTAGVLAAAGRQVYARCAGCHGANGEGGYGPALIGSGTALAARGNARALFDYIRQEMPLDAPGSLTPQQYLEVTSFLLLSNNFVQSNVALSPDNLAAIPLNR